MRRLSALCVLLLALAPGARASSGSQRVVLGWNFGGTTDSYLRLASSAAGLNTLSPSWWRLKPDMSVADRGDRAYSDAAHARGMRVWPMFTNSLDQDASHLAVTDPGARAAVIARIADLATTQGADGVNIDWENLRIEDRDGFTLFVAEAAAAWRARGLTVSVDVTARTDSWEMDTWTESFDRAALGTAADLIVLMAYDEHNRLKPDGPTASLPWVEESVRYLLRTVPASKVLLGVPLYTRDWSDEPGKAAETVTIAATPQRLKDRGAALRWDDTLGLGVATYSKDGHAHRIWVEDARSLAMKAALVDKYGLAGIAAWRLGFGTPAAWHAISGAGVPAPVARAAATPRATPAPAPVVTPAPATPTPELVASTPVVVAAAPVRQRSRAPFVMVGVTLLAAAAIAVRLARGSR